MASSPKMSVRNLLSSFLQEVNPQCILVFKIHIEREDRSLYTTGIAILVFRRNVCHKNTLAVHNILMATHFVIMAWRVRTLRVWETTRDGKKLRYAEEAMETAGEAQTSSLWGWLQSWKHFQ